MSGYATPPYDYAAAAAAMDASSESPQPSPEEQSRQKRRREHNSNQQQQAQPSCSPDASVLTTPSPTSSSSASVTAAATAATQCRPTVTITVQPPSLPNHAVSYLSTADRSNADSCKTDGVANSSVMPTLSPISAFTSSEEGNAMQLDRTLSNSTAANIEQLGHRQLTSSSSMSSSGSLRHLTAYPRSERLATRTLADVGRNASVKQMARDDSFINIPNLEFVGNTYPTAANPAYPVDVLARRQSSDGLNLASHYFASKMQQMAAPMTANSMVAVGGNDMQMHQLVHNLHRPYSPAAAAPRERTAMERKLSINSLLNRMVNSGSSGSSPHDSQVHVRAGVPVTYTTPTTSRRISQHWQQQPMMQPLPNTLHNHTMALQPLHNTQHQQQYQQYLPQSHQVTRAVLAGSDISHAHPAPGYQSFNYLTSPTHSPPHTQQHHQRAHPAMMTATATVTNGNTATGSALPYHGHSPAYHTTPAHAQPQPSSGHSPHQAAMTSSASGGHGSPHSHTPRPSRHLAPSPTSPTPSEKERAATAAILQSAQRLKPPMHSMNHWSNDGLGRLASVSSETFTMQFGQRDGDESHQGSSRLVDADMQQQPSTGHAMTGHHSSHDAPAAAAPASPHPSTGTGVLSEIINYEVPNADIRHPEPSSGQADSDGSRKPRSRKESLDSNDPASSEGGASTSSKFQTGDDFVCTWCGKSGVIGTAKLMRREKVDAIKRTARPRWAEHDGRKIRVCNSCGIYFGRNKCLPPLDPNGKEAAGQQGRLRRYFEEQANTQQLPPHHSSSAAPKSPAKKEGRGTPRALRSASSTGPAMTAATDSMQPPSGALVKTEETAPASSPARRHKRTSSDAFQPHNAAAPDAHMQHHQQQQHSEHSRTATQHSSASTPDAYAPAYPVPFHGASLWHSHSQPQPQHTAHPYPHPHAHPYPYPPNGTAYAVPMQPNPSAQTQLDLLHQATALPAHIQQAYSNVSNHYSPGHPPSGNAGGPPPPPPNSAMPAHAGHTQQPPQQSPASAEDDSPSHVPTLNHQQSITGHTMHELSNLSVQQLNSNDTAPKPEQSLQISGKSTPSKQLPTDAELQLFTDLLRTALNNRDAMIAMYQCGCLTSSLESIGMGRKPSPEAANGHAPLPPYSSQLLHSSPKRRFLPPPSSQLAYSHPSLSIDLAATHLINQQHQPTLSRGLVSPTPLRPAPTLPTGRTLSATSVGSLHHLHPHGNMSLHGHLSSSPSAAIESFMQATPTADSQPPAHQLAHHNSSTHSFNTLHMNSANNVLTPPATNSAQPTSGHPAGHRFPQFPDTQMPKAMVR